MRRLLTQLDSKEKIMLTRKTLSLAVSALAAGVMLSGAVQAQDLIDNRPNVYGGTVGYFFDDEWDQDDDWGWMIGGEAPISERWSLGLEQYNLSSERELAPGDADYTLARLGLNYHLNPVAGWQPYLSAGAGYARQDNDDMSLAEESEGSFDFGVGAKRFFTEHLFFRGDAKAIHVSDLGYWDFAVGLGVGYAFGPKPVAAPPPAPAPAPAPRPAPPPPPPQPTRVTLSADALFDFDSAELQAEGRQSLDVLVEDLRGFTYEVLIVGGHTDRIGSDEYNQGLSERRANTVRDYLVQSGIPAADVRSTGYGESRPVTTLQQCQGQAGAALISCLQPDRRVEVEVSGTRNP
jgi:outer membrane protein OmpA-like peptidoglycan-associated protein